MTDLGDNFAGVAFERGALDDILGLSGCTVSLALDDLTREDDVFKVEDGEVVIFKFVRGVSGNDVAERTDQMAKVCDGHLGHAQVYEASAYLWLCFLSSGSVSAERSASGA